ncbi:Lecithin-cholesterol acyltransferase-like [Trichinella pseudospiralis]
MSLYTEDPPHRPGLWNEFPVPIFWSFSLVFFLSLDLRFYEKEYVFCTLAVYWALLVHVAAILILESASLHCFVDICLFSYNLDDFSCAPSAQTYISSLKSSKTQTCYCVAIILIARSTSKVIFKFFPCVYLIVFPID